MNEPVVAPPGAAVGSSQFPVLRVLAIAGLSAFSALSLGIALFATPFLPMLVAVHLRRDPAPSFVAAATVASVLAVLGTCFLRGYGAGATVAIAAFYLLLIGPLSILQAWASHPDPIIEPEGLDADAPRFNNQTGESLYAERWPEPVLTRGFSLVLVSWFVPMLLCIAILLPAVSTPQLQDSLASQVRAQYGDLDKDCAAGGRLDGSTRICDALKDNERQLLAVVRNHLHLALGTIVALVAFGAAWTSHQVTLWRLRATGIATRPKRPLREFETHWSVAYVVAIGLVLLITMSDPTNEFARWGRAVGIGVVVFGAQLIAAQGLGLAAFGLQGLRGWRRVALIVFGVLAWEFVLPLVLLLGIIDLAVHPRRRISASLPGRGSGS